MIKGINLSLKDDDFKREYIILSEAIVVTSAFNNKKDKVKEKLEGIFKKSPIPSATELQKYFFDIMKSDIFISHSSKDNILIGKLTKNIKKRYFVDSYVWGNIYEINKFICDRYAKKVNGNYDYNEVIKINNYLNNILFTSLAETMDKCKYVVFVNTCNSITPDLKTESPWIYSELVLSRLLAQKNEMSLNECMQKSADFKMTFDLNIDHLDTMNYNEFTNFINEN